MILKKIGENILGEFTSYQEGWESANEQEASDYFLNNVKKDKLKELKDYYNSDECWKFKVQSTTLAASITKTAEWFRGMIPVCAGKQFMMFTDTGTLSVDLSVTKAENLNFEIQVELSFDIREKYTELKDIINSSTIDGLNGEGIKTYLSKEELENLDVKTCLDEVPRIVEFDTV